MIDRTHFKKQLMMWLLEEVPFKTTAEENILSFICSKDRILKNLKVVPMAQRTPRAIVVGQQEEVAQMTLYIKGHSFNNSSQIYHELNMNQDCPLYFSIDNTIDFPKNLGFCAMELNPYITISEMLGPQLDTRIHRDIEWNQIKLCHDLLWNMIEQTIEQNNPFTFQFLSLKYKKLEEFIDEWRKNHNVSNDGRYAT